MFKLSFHSTILRYYLMMLTAIGVVYSQQYWLAFIPMLIAVSAVLGYRFEWSGSEEKGKVIQLEGAPEKTHRKAG